MFLLSLNHLFDERVNLGAAISERTALAERLFDAFAFESATRGAESEEVF